MVIIIEPRLGALVRAEARGEPVIIVPEATVGEVLRLAGAVLGAEELACLRDRLGPQAPGEGSERPPGEVRAHRAPQQRGPATVDLREEVRLGRPVGTD